MNDCVAQFKLHERIIIGNIRRRPKNGSFLYYFERPDTSHYEEIDKKIRNPFYKRQLSKRMFSLLKKR